MKTLAIKHLLQAFLIPATGVTGVWFGHLLPSVLPNYSLSEWVAVCFAVVLLLELVAYRMEKLGAIVISTTALFIVLPMAPFIAHSVLKRQPAHDNLLDHGGAVLALLAIALLSLQFRLTRAAVEFGNDYSMPMPHCQPRETLADRLDREEQEHATALGYPTLSSGAARHKRLLKFENRQ